jgi:hypothetical protein
VRRVIGGPRDDPRGDEGPATRAPKFYEAAALLAASRNGGILPASGWGYITGSLRSLGWVADGPARLHGPDAWPDTDVALTDGGRAALTRYVEALRKVGFLAAPVESPEPEQIEAYQKALFDAMVAVAPVDVAAQGRMDGAVMTLRVLRGGRKGPYVVTDDDAPRRDSSPYWSIVFEGTESECRAYYAERTGEKPEPTPAQILAVPVAAGDSIHVATTVRGYLVALLAELWRDSGSFTGKRPFGDSSWDHDLYAALIRAGVVEGSFDEDGFIADFDRRDADLAIAAAITELAGPDWVAQP